MPDDERTSSSSPTLRKQSSPMESAEYNDENIRQKLKSE